MSDLRNDKVRVDRVHPDSGSLAYNERPGDRYAYWMPLPPPPEALSKLETTTPPPKDKTEDRANG